MSDQVSDRRERALDALSKARREELPLSAVAPLVRLSPDEVVELTPGGWAQRGADLFPTDYDHLRRDMSVLTPDGPINVVIRDSREATFAAQHAIAVRHYRDEGLTDWLQRLPRDWVATDAGRVQLVTKPADLDRLIEGSELSYDLYQRL
jgi:hypothetical protein